MKTKPKINHYTYRVIWSEDDNEFVGLCAEFPSLSYLASTKQEASSGIHQIVADVVEDMAANDEAIPEPCDSKH